jgi:hypothetical protein
MLWNQILSSALIEIGYKPTPDDSCAFVKFDSEGRRSIVIVHVDDLMHIFEAEKFQRELLAMLTSKFSAPTVHEGNDGIYVGIEYHYNRSDRSVLLSMKKYTDNMEKLCKKKPVFYVIAEPDKFKKAYEKRDPILLVQSPFGFYWQILGAWDKEMILLSEL